MFKKLFATALMFPAFAYGWGLGWGSGTWACGPYAGVGIGVDTADFQQTAYITQPRNFKVTNKTQQAAQGALGDLYAGYSFYNDRMYYLAAELNIAGSTARFHVTNVDKIHGTVSNTKVNINREWGLSVLPGLMLPECTLVYARLGVARGHFRISTSDTSLRNASTERTGARIGLGIDKRVCNNLGLRFEYSHFGYHHHKEKTFDARSITTKKTITYPRTNQFELGLSYWFC